MATTSPQLADVAGQASSAHPRVPPGLRERAEEVLRALVGREDARLREDQWRAVEALVVGRRRVLVVERTGWGKSAVYFVATALIREGWGPHGQVAGGRRPGATVIISPLLALMRDQVAAARRERPFDKRDDTLTRIGRIAAAHDPPPKTKKHCGLLPVSWTPRLGVS